ncbi:MAG: anthranilate phosphoribosyltransferase [Chitinophagales bacterium]|nr:anthranilate phosphoribosyltransferase [Hyphomicrobiales bacterium]
MTAFKPFLEIAATGQSLSAIEAAGAFDLMMDGEVSAPIMAGFLMALRARGETADEILGAVRAMRSHMLRVNVPQGAIDIVGTGGDARGTYNVSTCAAFVAAGAGAIVAKHGNRAVSSKSGSADVLEALGVNVNAGAEVAARCVAEAGVGFLFAPAHHSAMRHVAPVRKELGVRTIFNLLGPLANPAETKRMVIGVFSPAWLEPMAHVLRHLGAGHVWVVHGEGGLDELSTLGPSRVVELRDGNIRAFDVTAADAGLPEAPLEALIGGGPEQNAAAIVAVLNGEQNAFRDIVILNAAAGLIVAGKAQDLKEGATLAARSIHDGQARAALAKLIKISNC